jgi:hypothetical protein
MALRDFHGCRRQLEQGHRDARQTHLTVSSSEASSRPRIQPLGLTPHDRSRPAPPAPRSMVPS